jgi:hypothetical protein
MCINTHNALTAPLVLHRTRIGKYAMKNLLHINGQWRKKLFCVTYLLFFTCNGRYDSLRATLFMTTYRMSPISAGYISLDNYL